LGCARDTACGNVARCVPARGAAVALAKVLPGRCARVCPAYDDRQRARCRVDHPSRRDFPGLHGQRGDSRIVRPHDEGGATPPSRCSWCGRSRSSRPRKALSFEGRVG